MSERWKYQLKTGLFWGITMAIITTLFDAFENETPMVFLTLKFLLKFVAFSICGVFFIGYFNWKAKEKIEKK